MDVLGTGWGSFRATKATAEISLAEGKLSLCAVSLPFLVGVRTVRIDGRVIPFEKKNGEILFERTEIRDKIEFFA